MQIGKTYLDKKSVVIPIIKDYLPRDDMVASLNLRNNLAGRIASCIIKMFKCEDSISAVILPLQLFHTFYKHF